MKHILGATLIISLSLSGHANSFAPGTESCAGFASQDQSKGETDEDRVYHPREVDVKAKIRNAAETAPGSSNDCPVKGWVSLRVVLHKSGEVTEVVLIRRMNCSYDERVVEAARKLKFTPAMKDGRAVSQYLRIEYRLNIY
jgi:TonB family protein